MRIATVHLKSLAPYSASKVFDSERGPKESHDDFEQRCCRERLNVNPEGVGIIPPMAFKQMLDKGAKNYPVKLKGNTTYTKYFESGVLVMEPLILSGTTRQNVSLEKLFVPSDGIPGSGKRVWKWFPVVHQWGGAVVFHVLDDIIKESVFEDSVRQALSFVGVGRFRPEKRGFYGRAELVKVAWS